MAPARGFLFVIFEELPEIGVGKVIRKVAAIPYDFSLKPDNPFGTLSLAEHAQGIDLRNSPFLSASNRPFGAPTMLNGEPVILDVAKIQGAGGRIYTVPEVVNDLKRFAIENPTSKVRVDRLISIITDIEGEVLIGPRPSLPPELLVDWGTPPGAATRPGPAHSPYIRAAEDLWQKHTAGKMTRAELEQGLAKLGKAYNQARFLGRVGRVLTVFAIVITVDDLINAGRQSISQHSFRPITAETVRQAGGWGGAVAGARIGFQIGALFGIETGPGAIATGAVGAIVFGAIGYFSAGWIARHI